MNYVTRRHKSCSLVSCRGITVYQFTEHYITNANTVPMVILFFPCDFRGMWQADKQRLCGRLIRRCAACGWLVNVPALPTNPCQLNVNQGRIKHAAHTACPHSAKPVPSCHRFHLSSEKRFLQPCPALLDKHSRLKNAIMHFYSESLRAYYYNI